MKINVSMRDDLLTELDAYAKDNYLTRSGAISICVNERLNQQKVISCLNSLQLCMDIISKEKCISEETKYQLDSILSILNSSKQ